MTVKSGLLPSVREGGDWECKCRKQYLYLERCILFVGQKPWQLIWDGAPSHLVQYIQNKIQALSKGAHLNRWHWEIGTQKEAATCSRRCGWGGQGRASRSFQVVVHVLNEFLTARGPLWSRQPSCCLVQSSGRVQISGTRCEVWEFSISAFWASVCCGEFICSIWFCPQCLCKVASSFLADREVSHRARVFQLQAFGKYEPSPSKSWDSFNTHKVFL